MTRRCHGDTRGVRLANEFGCDAKVVARVRTTNLTYDTCRKHVLTVVSNLRRMGVASEVVA